MQAARYHLPNLAAIAHNSATVFPFLQWFKKIYTLMNRTTDGKLTRNQQLYGRPLVKPVKRGLDRTSPASTVRLHPVRLISARITWIQHKKRPIHCNGLASLTISLLFFDSFPPNGRATQLCFTCPTCPPNCPRERPRRPPTTLVLIGAQVLAAARNRCTQRQRHSRVNWQDFQLVVDNQRKGWIDYF